MGHVSPAALSSLGLLLDIAGVVLLFFFGLPNEASFSTVLEWGRRDSNIVGNHAGCSASAALPAVPCAEIEN